MKTFKFNKHVFNVCAETHIQKSINGKDGVALYSYYVLQNSTDGAHGVSAGIESAPMFKSASEAIKQGGRAAQRVALLKELAAEGRFDN